MHNSWFPLTQSQHITYTENRLTNFFFMKKLPEAVQWKCHASVSGSLFCTVNWLWFFVENSLSVRPLLPHFTVFPPPWWLLRQKSPVPHLKLTRIQNSNPRIFTDISDRSYVVTTGTLGRGYKSALTKCVNSLPPKQSALFIVFLFLKHQRLWRSSADGGKFDSTSEL